MVLTPFVDNFTVFANIFHFCEKLGSDCANGIDVFKINSRNEKNW